MRINPNHQTRNYDIHRVTLTVSTLTHTHPCFESYTVTIEHTNEYEFILVAGVRVSHLVNEFPTDVY